MVAQPHHPPLSSEEEVGLNRVLSELSGSKESIESGRMWVLNSSPNKVRDNVWCSMVSWGPLYEIRCYSFDFTHAQPQVFSMTPHASCAPRRVGSSGHGRAEATRPTVEQQHWGGIDPCHCLPQPRPVPALPSQRRTPPHHLRIARSQQQQQPSTDGSARGGPAPACHDPCLREANVSGRRRKRKGEPMGQECVSFVVCFSSCLSFFIFIVCIQPPTPSTSLDVANP